MTITPQPGDVWDRNGQVCRVTNVAGIEVTVVDRDGREHRETIGQFRFGDGIYEPKLIERDGRAVPHD